MIIQTVTLEGVFGRYWGIHTFQKITDNNGNVIEFECDYKDGLTEEEVSKIYKNYLKIGTDMKRKLTTQHITISDYIAMFYKGIDKYVEYIDDGRQYREAVEANNKLYKKIEQYTALKENGVE